MRRFWARPVAGALMLFCLIGTMALVFAVTRADLIPEWLVRKREFEEKYQEAVRARQAEQVCEEEELERIRAEAPKDEKGNPNLPGNPKVLHLEMAPNEDVRVVERTTTVYLPSPKREGYTFTSEAYTPYDVLIAASVKEDPATGVIFRVTFTLDGAHVQEQRFPGKGPIVLESVTDGNTVVTFRWGNNGKGRYELRDGTAFFEEQ